MTDTVFQDKTVRESFLRLIPMNRPGLPQDLAGAAVFLASDASLYVTGQTLYIDGGWLAGGGNPLA
jgi:2-deoxy-D-gluconate 3-dehydrogenase